MSSLVSNALHAALLEAARVFYVAAEDLGQG